LNNCSVLACGHGYHNHCAYLNVWYLQLEIKKILNALKESMTKRLNENEFIENIENIKNTKNTVDDDLGNVESAANRL